MLDRVRSILAVLAAVAASLPWWWIVPAALTLLGVAGSATATVVAGWIAPVLVCLSVALLGRSFYIIYKRKRASRAVKVLTWLSATFIAGFWTWWLLS